jgi:hypothetical protein
VSEREAKGTNKICVFVCLRAHVFLLKLLHEKKDFFLHEAQKLNRHDHRQFLSSQSFLLITIHMSVLG